jgi:hypothetical protein
MGLLAAAIACRPNCAHCRDTVKGFPGFRSALKDEADIDRQAKPAGSVENDPLRTLPIRAFEWNHCKLDEIDQDMLEYLYSGAALS